MAIVNISFNCGCGFKARMVEKAVEHSDKCKHTIDVLGTVQPEKRKVRAPSTPTARPRRYVEGLAATAAVGVVEEQAAVNTGFNNLRARLQKK